MSFGQLRFMVAEGESAENFIALAGQDKPTTPTAYNSALIEIFKIVDALADPARVFKRGASARLYPSVTFRGGLGASVDAAYSGKQVPVVGELSLPQMLPAYWWDNEVGGSTPSIDSDRQMWGLGLLQQAALFMMYYRLVDAAPPTGGVVISTPSVEAGSVIAVPEPYANGFAPVNLSGDPKATADAKQLVVFAPPFSGRCDVSWQVIAGAFDFSRRLGQFLTTGQAVSPAVDSQEGKPEVRAQAAQMASSFRNAVNKRSTNMGRALMTGVGVVVVGGLVATLAHGKYKRAVAADRSDRKRVMAANVRNSFRRNGGGTTVVVG